MDSGGVIDLPVDARHRLKLYLMASNRNKLYLYFSIMANPKGNPQNLEPGQRKGEVPLTEQVNLRVTKEMKEAIKAQDDPPEYCRQAIQEKLDRDKNKNK